MADTSAGFRPRYRLSGQPFTVQNLVFDDTETLTKGDMLELNATGVDLAASGDTPLVGVALETKSGTADVTYIEVITDEDAVYGVYDANARVVGATLDISGNTGAMTVTTSGDKDLTVVANSAADEETLVKISHGIHFHNVEQET